MRKLGASVERVTRRLPAHGARHRERGKRTAARSGASQTHTLLSVPGQGRWRVASRALDDKGPQRGTTKRDSERARGLADSLWEPAHKRLENTKEREAYLQTEKKKQEWRGQVGSLQSLPSTLRLPPPPVSPSFLARATHARAHVRARGHVSSVYLYHTHSLSIPPSGRDRPSAASRAACRAHIQACPPAVAASAPNTRKKARAPTPVLPPRTELENHDDRPGRLVRALPVWL